MTKDKKSRLKHFNTLSKEDQAEWICNDCGKNCFLDEKDYYMLHSPLFFRLNGSLKGMLCMDCVEKKLGRKLSADDIRICPLTIAQGKYTRNILLKYLSETFPNYTEFVLVDILQQACDMEIDYVESLIEIVKWKTE
jgi:hypothetical protein